MKTNKTSVVINVLCFLALVPFMMVMWIVWWAMGTPFVIRVNNKRVGTLKRFKYTKE